MFVFALAFFVASCASSAPQKKPATQKQTAPVVTAVKQQSAKSSFVPVFQRKDPRSTWWNLYESGVPVKKKPVARSFDVFKKREFLFDKDEKHDYQKLSATAPIRMKEATPKPFAPEWEGIWRHAANVFVGLLLLSVIWRGFSLIALFFRLWQERRREEIFNHDLISTSNLVPPVSLFLYSTTPGSELLNQISAVERLEYEEVELIVFRDARWKDEDAVLLKDFRLRFRSPLYFADLDSEDPFEILEVQGERRILLVYSQPRQIKTVLTLFLKLARYPLIGILNEQFVVNPASVSNLVYRWLREGEKTACVYGFLTDKKISGIDWIDREGLFLTGIASSRLEWWLGQNQVFGLMPKNMAIQLMEFGGSRYQSALWSEIAEFQIVGARKKQFLKAGFKFAPFVNEGRSIFEIFNAGVSRYVWKPLMDKISWIAAGILWPLIILNFAAYLIFLKQADVSVLFLSAAEMILFCLVALIWGLFAQNILQKISPSQPRIFLREKQQIHA